MEYTTLGRTNLRVSVMGLGGGGHSRLGQQTGVAETDSIEIVRRAVDLGVNFVDTAEAYGTEPLIGKALKSVGRDRVYLSTKKSMSNAAGLITPDDLVRGLEGSLTRLQTDHLDVYHLHGVTPQQYDHAVSELLPTLQRLRDEGKIRFIGITEQFANDTGHEMASRAVQDGYWDVMMIGFNILNQSARERVLAEAQRQNIGILCMFAVRDALSRPEKLKATLAELVREGKIAADEINADDPFDFVTATEGVAGIPDAAYRFCRAEPGIHVVLSGTGNSQHLEQNAASILSPPLPAALHDRLVQLFEGIDTVSGQ